MKSTAKERGKKVRNGPMRLVSGIREHDDISITLDSEIWGEVPRVTIQDNFVIVPIRERRYSDFEYTQQDTKIFSKRAIKKCKSISAKIDLSICVCNLFGCVGSIPSDIIAFAYYPYVACFRTCYYRHKNISPFQRGSKGREGQKN